MAVLVILACLKLELNSLIYLKSWGLSHNTHVKGTFVIIMWLCCIFNS